MTNRYFVEQPIETDAATLTDAEAHHFLHVMRGKVDDQLTLFDGSGVEFSAVVTSVTRRDVQTRIIDRHPPADDSTSSLHFLVPLPKGDRSRWLVEKLTELGATSLTPLITARSESPPSDKAIEKMRRYSIEACKQSGRNRLLDFGAPCRIESLADALDWNSLRLVAHPYRAKSRLRDIQDALTSAMPIVVAVGPEGGFTDEEIADLQDLNFQAVSLGPRILRIETAALALAATIGLHKL